jgi:hypothetical protein
LPKPFIDLVPYGAGIDTLYGNAQMTKFAQLSLKDPEGAVQKAKDAAALYLSEGQTRQDLAWYFPVLAREGPDTALKNVWLQLNLVKYGTPEELSGSPVWGQTMEKLVPIRRAWGVLGLFWTLLLDELEGGRRYGVCNTCGRVFTGKRDKQFCGRKDDISCYRERRASDRRNERENVTKAAEKRRH